MSDWAGFWIFLGLFCLGGWLRDGLQGFGRGVDKP